MANSPRARTPPHSSAFNVFKYKLRANGPAYNLHVAIMLAILSIDEGMVERFYGRAGYF